MDNWYEAARQWYSADDTVHGFSHIQRVYALCETIGQAEGADLRIVRMAALLHDVEAADEPDVVLRRENHHLSAARFAGTWLLEQGWADDDIAAVQHCIRAHRFRDEKEMPQSLEAKVLFDADKLDSIGAVGAARAIAYAAQHGKPFYAAPSSQFLSGGGLTAGEVHTAYHEYWFKLRHIHTVLMTSTGKRMAETRHQFMQLYFEQLITEVEGKL